MSNIANQLVAVVATLLGFVAHDALTERGRAPATEVASINQSVDPVVTRAVDLEGISSEWLNASPRAEREAQARPSMPRSEGTAAARLDTREVQTEFADVRANDVHFAIEPRQQDKGFLR